MKFYERLDAIMKQDFGARGLLSSLPASPIAQTARSLAQARHAILLTGFPVRLPDGSVVGETGGSCPARSVGRADSAPEIRTGTIYRRACRNA